MDGGVLWLNQALTNGGYKMDKEQHYRYWKPIIRSILFTILSSKKNLKKKHGKKGTLFIVFDKKTKNFVRSIQSQIDNKKKTKCKILKMDYDLNLDFKKHFNQIKFMQKVNEQLELMDMDGIKWLKDDIVQRLRTKIVSKSASSKTTRKRKFDHNEWTEENDIKTKKRKYNDNHNHSHKEKEEAKEDIDLTHNNNKYDDGCDSDEFSC